MTNNSESNAQTIRDRVSQTYADAVLTDKPLHADGAADSKNSTASCDCQCTCDEATAGSRIASSKGVAVQTAGYTDDHVSQLPDAAVENSFGCGNPLAFSEVEAGQTVLDLGSGAGIDLLIAASKVGKTGRVIGVDMTDAMLDKARANIEEAGLSDIVEVRQGIIEKLPVEDNSVDWIISNCVVNLSPEKDRVFAEIARVLKPGGRMLISDIVADHIPESIRDIPRVHDTCLAGAISEKAFVEGLESAGLEAVEVRSRIRYDANQVGSILNSECCSTGIFPEAIDVDHVAKELAGNVWSANVFARKPLAACCEPNCC